MRYFSIPVLIAISLILSACGARGAPAAPTVNPADIQNTMAAAAFTVVAETQAAIPTATPVPPTATFTDTPVATDTLPALPSLAATLTPESGSSSGSQDPCVDKPLPSTLQGQPVRLRISNSTEATLRLSVYLNSNASQSQCGYRAYNIAPQESIILNDLVVGCYTLWAWNSNPEEYFIVTNGTTCVDSADTWVFDITTRSITVRT